MLFLGLHTIENNQKNVVLYSVDKDVIYCVVLCIYVLQYMYIFYFTRITKLHLGRDCAVESLGFEAKVLNLLYGFYSGSTDVFKYKI